MALAEPPARSSARAGTRRRGWTWNDINLVLDAALLVVFAALCFAAVVVRFVFPPGPAAAGWTLWRLDYDAWGGVQFGLLSVLAGGILVHVMFHWSWVCTMVASRLSGDRRARVDDGLQTIYGVGLLIVLLVTVGGAAAAVLTIRPPHVTRRRPRGRMRTCSPGGLSLASTARAGDCARASRRDAFRLRRYRSSICHRTDI
jgi:hypothetical protein